MSKFFLLSHPKRRFDSEFMYLSTAAEFCKRCGGRVDNIPIPLEFYCDDEPFYVKARRQQNRGFLWGEHLLVVSEDARNNLESLFDGFEFFDIRPVQTQLIRDEFIVKPLMPPEERYYWAVPKAKIRARVKGSPNYVCAACGFFVTHSTQLTRLLVDEPDLPADGIFSVAQNRSPQIFVTEKARDRLLSMDISAGFYPAGKVASI